MQSKRGLAKDEAWKTIHNTKSAASLPACLWGSFQRKKLPVKAHDNPGKRGKMELKWHITRLVGGMWVQLSSSTQHGGLHQGQRRPFSALVPCPCGKGLGVYEHCQPLWKGTLAPTAREWVCVSTASHLSKETLHPGKGLGVYEHCQPLWKGTLAHMARDWVCMSIASH
eukprot:1161675-Pelagomonas_calceolata.AAC.1